MDDDFDLHKEEVVNLNQKAIASCKLALEIQPDNAEIYVTLGRFYIQNQQWDDAAIILETAIRLSPNLTEAYYALGEVWITLKQWQNAINIFTKLIILNPDNAWNYYLLGDGFMGVNDWEQAFNAYKQAICLNNNHDWFYQKLGDSLQKLNKFDEAIDAYKKAINIKPCPWYYAEIGNILIDQHKWNEAIAILIQSLQTDPDYYQAYDKIGIIFEKLGKTNFSKLCRMGYKIPPSVMLSHSKLQHDYAISTKDHSFNKILIYSSKLVNLLNPKTINYNHQSSDFCPKVVKFPETFIVEVKNGRVWGSSCTSAIITEDQKIISDLSTGSPEIILTSNFLPKPMKFSGKIAILSVQYTYNYFHWMFETIARLSLLLKAGIFLDELDGILMARYGHKYEQETLDLLKIPKNKIIDSSTHHIQAKSLVIPSVSPRPLITHEWCCNMLRDLILKSKQFQILRKSDYSFNRIYISRNKSQYRKILNEAELIDLLHRFRFQVITLENMSVIEQAAYFQQAEVVLSPHGASLTNLVFCNGGTKVIEIFSPGSMIDYYWKLSCICNLDYYYLIGENQDSLTPTEAHIQSFKVDINLVLQTLNLAQII